jgi:hypothetical protein
MSNLYIQVKTGFYSHRKTARLRALIGDDAFWVVPRLWAYAAEHQPDGDLSSYDSMELANLIGCYKHATSMLQALKEVGYVDADGKIHDWDEHNGYHAAYSARAKKAAEARWGKKSPTPPKDTDIDKDKDTSIATSIRKQCLEHATSIYEAYPKKKDRPHALKAIQKALEKVQYETLLALTKEYAELVKHRELQYIPYPATWFNAEGYNDNEVVKLENAGRKNETHKHLGQQRDAFTAKQPGGEGLPPGFGEIV